MAGLCLQVTRGPGDTLIPQGEARAIDEVLQTAARIRGHGSVQEGQFSALWEIEDGTRHVSRGGQRTRDEARQAAAEAIGFTLGSETDAGPDDHLDYLDVAVG